MAVVMCLTRPLASRVTSGAAYRATASPLTITLYAVLLAAVAFIVHQR